MTKPFVSPRILVLEGLYADTAEIIDDCGGIGIEASPWNPKEVMLKLESGNIDGLLLTGGTDVNPAYYGQKPAACTQTPDHTRDATELRALRYCLKARLPVLGICRGAQIMCVSRGGKLVQDIHLYTDAWGSHNGTSHDVQATAKAKTFVSACMGESINATSLHHQCVKDPGRGMRIAAIAPDGTPEAIESKDGLMLGVQFHPEMSAYTDEQAFNIFRWLVETAARRKGGKAYAANFREAQKQYLEESERAWNAYVHDIYGTESETYSATGYQLGWDDDYESGTTSTQASNPGRPARTSNPKRQAGDPAIPSMRAPSTTEMVRLIESSTGHSVIVTDGSGNVIDSTCEDEPFDCEIAKAEMVSGDRPPLPFETPRSDHLLEQSLMICPNCAVRFDCIEDCDDHKRYGVCTGGRKIDEMDSYNGRFPELSPPPAQWDDEAFDKLVVKMRREAGDWEDIDE